MMYDPRHTTGVSPVHKDVKRPLVYDPRRPGNRSQLHVKTGHDHRILALFIFLAFLLAVLAVSLWFLISILADRAAPRR